VTTWSAKPMLSVSTFLDKPNHKEGTSIRRS
jgi:hypothetical protein